MTTRFGEYIGDARRSKGVTLRELSEFVKLAPSNLSEIERGRRLPPKDRKILRSLAVVLDVDQERLEELASIERISSKPVLFNRLYSINREAALGLYRAQGEVSDQDFVKSLRDALKLLEKETS